MSVLLISHRCTPRLLLIAIVAVIEQGKSDGVVATVVLVVAINVGC